MPRHVLPLRERFAKRRMRPRRPIPILVIIGVLLGTCVAAGAQVIASQDDEQTDVSLAMNAAGTLAITEWYDLGDMQTTGGSLIDCDIVIVKLLGSGEEGVTSVGLQMEAEDGRRSAFVDRGELEGILAAIATIDDTGMQVLTSPMAGDLSGDLRRSGQISYRTKEDVMIAAFERRGELKYAIQIDRSDWYILSESGEAAFRRNLLLASQVAAAVDTGESR